MMFFGGWMVIVWILIIGLIIWGVIALTRHSGSRSGSITERAPLDIARERYAKGEITREEFERMKKALI